MNLHSTFKKNKKVFVIMRDGSTIIDRWLGKDHKYMILEETGKVRFDKVRSIGMYHQHRTNQARTERPASCNEY